MTQVVVNIEDPSVLSVFKKMVALMNGVSIAKPVRKIRKVKEKKCGIDLALEAAHGEPLYSFDSVDDMMDDLLREE